MLEDFYRDNPLKIGMSKEELRVRLPAVEPQLFQTALDECIAAGIAAIEKDKVTTKTIEKKVDRDAEILADNVLKKLYAYGLTPPTPKELSLELGKSESQIRDILEKLTYSNKATRVKGDLYFHREIMERIKEGVVSHLKEKKEMMPTDFRSIFEVSRKYMIPILEHLDEIKLTIRVGDKRVLRS
jgi:selenocysteine-specific elongation factor